VIIFKILTKDILVSNFYKKGKEWTSNYWKREISWWWSGSSLGM